MREAERLSGVLRMRRRGAAGLYGDYYRYEYKPDTGRRKLKPGRAKGSKASRSSSKSAAHVDAR